MCEVASQQVPKSKSTDVVRVRQCLHESKWRSGALQACWVRREDKGGERGAWLLSAAWIKCKSKELRVSAKVQKMA